MTGARRAIATFAILAASLGARGADAGEALVAVAANFTRTAEAIGAAFAAGGEHSARFAFGSTGQLYAQIAQGAPFDAFLAADRERPRQAAAAGLAAPDSRFTYAVGRLALYARTPLRPTGPEVLRAGAFDRIAVANPATAPYGAAAVETMAALGVHDDLAPKLARGANVAQAFQFVESGAAELGFVALAQVLDKPGNAVWVAPRSLHGPIAQDAVLLARAADNPAARAFLTFLRGPEARAIIKTHGYETGD